MVLLLVLVLIVLLFILIFFVVLSSISVEIQMSEFRVWNVLHWLLLLLVLTAFEKRNLGALCILRHILIQHR